jgi:hypothetical protein
VKTCSHGTAARVRDAVQGEEKRRERRVVCNGALAAKSAWSYVFTISVQVYKYEMSARSECAKTRCSLQHWETVQGLMSRKEVW